MRMRVFSAPTVIRTVLVAWRQVARKTKLRQPDMKPTPTALAAALLMDGMR